MRVPVSDMCRIQHRHDTDTYNYIELCAFLKLLVVSACQCLCRICIWASYMSWSIMFTIGLVWFKFYTKNM